MNNEYFFDHIYVFLRENYHMSKDVMIKNVYNCFLVPNSNLISVLYIPQNPVRYEIYNTMRQNKIIMDYFNTFYTGDFLGKQDFDDTVFKLNYMKQSYELGHKNILYLDFTYQNNFFTSDINNRKNILENFPLNIDGFVYLNYYNKPDIIKESINDFYYDVDVSTSMAFINACSISRRAIKNMLDNQDMVLKRFEYYLVHRNMPYDSLLKHIALKKY